MSQFSTSRLRKKCRNIELLSAGSNTGISGRYLLPRETQHLFTHRWLWLWKVSKHLSFYAINLSWAKIARLGSSFPLDLIILGLWMKQCSDGCGRLILYLRTWGCGWYVLFTRGINILPLLEWNCLSVSLSTWVKSLCWITDSAILLKCIFSEILKDLRNLPHNWTNFNLLNIS